MTDQLAEIKARYADGFGDIEQAAEDVATLLAILASLAPEQGRLRDLAAEVVRFYGTDRTWSLAFRALLGSRIEELGAAIADQDARPVEPLDMAWTEAEAALPEGWLLSLGVWPPKLAAFPDGEGLYEAHATAYDDDHNGPVVTAQGPTGTAALRALATALAAQPEPES
jgi:hypothetical protein